MVRVSGGFCGEEEWGERVMCEGHFGHLGGF